MYTELCMWVNFWEKLITFIPKIITKFQHKNPEFLYNAQIFERAYLPGIVQHVGQIGETGVNLKNDVNIFLFDRPVDKS